VKKVVPTKVATKSTQSSLDSDPVLGKALGAFSLPMTGAKNFNIKDYAGKKVVLYFYPKNMTPGCTQEGHDFTELASEFKKLNTVVLGISRDSVASHEKFIKKENYSIDLLSDEKETACKFFDVIKEKNMYGKKVMGIERSTFLVGEDGKVIRSWRKVKVDGHAADVLNFIKAHS
jgi:peroxiredoxin Q/BCP